MLKNQYIFARQTGKTGLQFYKFLEYMKQTSKTEEEKEYFSAIQKEWSEFCGKSFLNIFK